MKQSKKRPATHDELCDLAYHFAKSQYDLTDKEIKEDGLENSLHPIAMEDMEQRFNKAEILIDENYPGYSKRIMLVNWNEPKFFHNFGIYKWNKRGELEFVKTK